MSMDSDLRVLAKHLMLMEQIRAIETRAGGYASDKAREREVALQEYMANLPAVREILLREKK